MAVKTSRYNQHRDAIWRYTDYIFRKYKS